MADTRIINLSALRRYHKTLLTMIPEFLPLSDDIPEAAKSSGSAGTSTECARSDHSHPLQTSVSGNAGTATKLATARSINISDADGTNTGTAISFDGTQNGTIKLPATIKATLTGNASSADSVPWSGITSKPSSFTPSAHNQASSTINAMTGYSKPSSTSAIGTSDTLNSAIGKLEKALDGKQASGSYAAASHNHDASHINSGTLNVARIPDLDASKITSGTIDVARLPAGALPILKIVGNETERFALTSSDVQVGDTVQQTDNGLMYYVKDVTKLGSADGYAVYTAGAATSVPWSGITSKPSSFTPSAHNQASNTINAMTGYSKPSSTSAIGTSDTLNAAIGKLEKALDGKQASGSYAAASHNQASSTINAMTGYSKPSSTSAIGTSDTLNAAIGKLEKALDGKAGSSHNQASSTINAMTGYSKPSSTSAIGTSDTLNAAIGKLEKALDGKANSGTSLSDYGIADAKIASGTITLGSSSITPLTSSSSLNAAKLTGTAAVDTTGNAGTATKFASAQSVALTGAVTGTASSQAGWSVSTIWRSCMVGQSGSTSTNPWYKVATFAVTTANDDIMATFLVEDTYSSHKQGILKVHVRTDGSKVISSTASDLIWLSHTGFTLGDFVLVCPTAASSTAELWTRIATGYMYRRFTVLSEGSRSSTATRWTLLNAASAGQAASITTTGTQIESVLSGQSASSAGNAATVTGTAGTSTLAWGSEVTLYTVGGHAIKAKLPSNPNTDTKVKQYVGNTSTERPILSRYTIDEASQTANYVVYDTGVTNNPNKHTLTASGGFLGKLTGTPEGTTYVAAATAGNALVTSNATAFGALFNAPTKNYRVALSTWPSNGDGVILYSVSNANVSAGTNTTNKSLTWNADSGTLTATAFSGPLTGNVTGNVSGSSGSCTGNAKTATTLQTARTINGVSFDGSANITVADSTKLPLTGGTVTGTLILSKNQDADAATNSKPALIVGGSDTAAHMEIDANEVMAKGSGTTTAALYLNAGGGDVYIGGNTANYKSVTGRGKGSASLPVYTDADGIVTACGTSLGVSITGTAAKATGDVDGNAIKTTYAKLASPALTGTPTAPTAALGTNSTQIATTAFVNQNAARILTADTTIYVAQTEAGNGSGSSAANAMSTDNMWKYLASVRMAPTSGVRENSRTLTIKFVPNGTTSYGNITFDANKMPGVRNLVIDTSTGTASTTSNYTTNCPTFGNIYAFGGPLHVTLKNVYATGTIQAEYHARIAVNTFVGAARFAATSYGRMDIASGTYAIKNAGTDYLAKADGYGMMIIVTKTANFHFMEQCYFTGGIYLSDSGGRTYVRHDYIKLTGTKPIVTCTATGTKTGTSATAAGTAAKVVTLAEGQTFTLANNAVAYVTFDNTNTAANPTLNINSTGAKPIYFDGAAIPKAYLNKHVQYKFTYNGTQYICDNTFNRVEVASNHSFFQRNGSVGTTYNSGEWNWTGYSTSFTNGANVGGTVYGSLSGNASTASSAAKLTTARDINISDADGTNTGTKITFDGSAGGTIKLPATIKASITGNATNVTGTVAIANGGTGATTRLNAIKALVNENVSTNTTHFLGLKSDWSKVGYVSAADAKTVLGLKSAAYTESSAYASSGHALSVTNSGDGNAVTGISVSNHSITVLKSLDFATAGHTHSYLPLSGGTMTGNITMSASKSVIFDLSATTPTASTVRNFPIQFKSQSTAGNYAFAQNPFFEIPVEQTTNYGMGIGFSGSGLTIIGGGEAGRGIVEAESLTGGTEKIILASDGAIEFFTNCNTIANRVKTTIDTAGNFSGNAATATKLKTARTINGVSFDGSANITVADSTKVAKAGDTMTGNLTISKAGPVLCTKSTGMTRNTAPSAAVNTVEILGQDNAGKSTWGIYHTYGTDMANRAQLIAYNGKSTDNTWSGIGIGYDANGNVATNAPTPAFGDNTTKIATTAFVYSNAAKHFAAAQTIYVATAATGNGSGSSTSNYMSLADLRNYLATVHMHSSTADLNGSYSVTLLFKAGDSFGNATFDSNKLPGIRSIVINTSTGTASTTSNYSTNSPTFGNITVTGNISATIRNVNCTGRISAQYGAYVAVDTYVGLSSLHASNWAYVNVAKNMIIDVCDAHTDYLFAATNGAILAMWPGATVTINFRQQCWYTRCLFLSSNNGSIYVGYSSFKLTGTKPVSIWAGTGTLTGTSETAAGTAAKVVPLASGQTFTLATNATAKVRFTNDNTAANPTLNINSTGAKAIWWNGAAVAANMLAKNMTYDVKYDGTHYVIQNVIKRLTNNDYGVFRYSGDYATTYNSGSWNFSDWTPSYGTGLENSTFRGSHIGNIEQRVASGNYTYPILFSGTANATATTSTVPYFDVDVKINPSTSTIYATTFSGALSGNASTATKLATARTINGVSFDGSANITVADSTKLPLSGGTMTGNITMNGNSKSFVVKNDTYSVSFQVGSGGVNRGLYDTSLNKWMVYADASAVYLNGNASTATKLATARSINIQDSSATNTGTAASFDGSGNATIKLPATIKASITGNCSGSSGSCTGNAASATITKGNKGTGSYVNSVKTGNALVNADNTQFGTIFNAPTKNYRVGCATWPDSNDNIVFYSITNANVSSSTNTINKSMTWNGDTGVLSATGFSGPLTGNVTGNCSGSSGSCTGNAATATTLKTARTINGVSFDGSANITVADSTKVPLSGGTMTGALTQKHTGLVKGSAVSAWTCRDYRVIDNSGDSGDKPCLSWWRTAVGTDKKVSVTINAFKFADESTASASIGIHYPVDGDAYTSAPTPATADNSTKIATTAFVKAQGYTTASGHTHSYLPLAGGTVTGTLTLSRTTDAAGTADNKPALIVGGASTAAHIEMDANEILAKTDGTTVGTLNLNTDGGLVSVGTGGIKTTGAMTVAGDHSTIKSGLFVSGAKQNYAIAISTDAVTKGTAPSATANTAIEFYGKTVSKYQNRLGLIENTVTTANVNTMKMVAYNATSAENTGNCAITCNVNAEGTAYTSAPTPATADNSTKIATTAFVKAQGYITSSGTASNVSGTVAIANGGTGATTRLNALKALTNENVGTNATYFLTITDSWGKGGYTTVANAKTVLGLKSAAYTESSAYATSGHTHSYVPLAGGTMTGNLTISKSAPALVLKNTDKTRNTAPSAAVNTVDITCNDSADKRLWGIYHTYGTDKSARTQLISYKGTSTDNTWAGIGIGYDASGNAYTNAPTPEAADNSTKIATTAWVRGRLHISTSNPSGGTDGDIWFKYA